MLIDPFFWILLFFTYSPVLVARIMIRLGSLLRFTVQGLFLTPVVINYHHHHDNILNVKHIALFTIIMRINSATI